MIQIVDNFLSNEECQFLIDAFINNKKHQFGVDDMTYSFTGLNVIESNINYEHHIPKLKSKYYRNKILRIQLVNENTNVNENYHAHRNEVESINNNFVIFLNDNYIGGELEFENKDTIVPKLGRLVKFTAEEPHRVSKVKGNRYTLVGMLDNKITTGLLICNPETII